jgi:formylmethanofuran dehydrogenase subunit E
MMDESNVSGLAVCSFCGELVGADAVQYGDERLHPACYEALGVELAKQEIVNA